MRKLYFLLIILAVNYSVQAQKGTVKGVAFDTLSKNPVADATITILQKKDSSLVSFGMTDDYGRFTIEALPVGEYRLLITHVAYHNSNRMFSITESDMAANLGNVTMNDRTKVLDEVIVKSEAPPVTLIGDTVQYNAGSFRTQPNASVEQLLKKLPGMIVDKDGTITAQGQKVNRVLVDGKEFFGNDPKMATKNLPADAIDKIQAYDKKSDQAMLTGFDDGNSEKVINLKLKEDKKKGSFGKIMGGGGTDDRLEGRFNVNSFKGARQMSVVGMGNNTNTEGFSFMDMMNFSGELGRMMRGGGPIRMSEDDPIATMLAGSNQGIRTIWGGGANYNNILGKKTELASNYFYNHFNPKTISEIERQYILPDSSYFYRQNRLSDNINNSHRLNLTLDYVIDSFHSLKISPSIGYQKTDNRSIRDYSQFGSDGQISNLGNSSSLSKSSAMNLRNDLLFRKKFRRRGRTLSFSLQNTINDSEGNVSLESLNEFYDRTGFKYRTDSINQRIRNTSDLIGYTARAVYTEPLFKRSLLEFSIGKAFTTSNSDKITYDYDKGSGKYDALNDSLTNNFRNTYGTVNAGFRVRTQRKKYNYSVGLSIQEAELEGKIISGIKDSVITKTFTNLLPNARAQYYFTRFKSLTLTYATSTNQPTVSQLQPVPDISDRLNIRNGNPNLKQEYTHNLQINYNGLNPYKNKTLFANFRLSRTENKIVNFDSLFANGVKSTRPVNVDGVYNMQGDVSVGFPIKAVKGNFRLGSLLFYNSGAQFINGLRNNINTFIAGPRVNLDMDLSDKLTWTIGSRFNFNRSTYSLQKAFNTSYFSQEYETQVDLVLPKGFNFSTEFTYTINNQLSSAFNTKVPLWGASISKQMLRYNRGELKIRVNDILNRNVGVSRNSNQNYIEDSRVNTLRRYAILSFTYSLSKTGLNNTGGGMIMRAR